MNIEYILGSMTITLAALYLAVYFILLFLKRNGRLLIAAHKAKKLLKNDKLRVSKSIKLIYSQKDKVPTFIVISKTLQDYSDDVRKTVAENLKQLPEENSKNQLRLFDIICEVKDKVVTPSFESRGTPMLAFIRDIDEEERTENEYDNAEMQEYGGRNKEREGIKTVRHDVNNVANIITEAIKQINSSK